MKNILVTNDDGIFAPGIKALVESIKDLGRVLVMAPNKIQSGMGHAVTLNSPLRVEEYQLVQGVQSFSCNGTPVDCVKLAVDKFFKKKPDICLSGINHGANHSINILYSGTMSAAIEAAIEGIPSIGFSLLDFSLEADFSEAQTITRSLVKKLLDQKISTLKLCLNVNIPPKSSQPIKGFKICNQAKAKYDESYVKRKDPQGREYYWMSGKFRKTDSCKTTDVDWLEKNYTTIVPVCFDLTDYLMTDKLKKIWNF